MTKPPLAAWRKKLAIVSFLIAGLFGGAGWLESQDFEAAFRWKRAEAEIIESKGVEGARLAAIVYQYEVDGQTYRSSTRSYEELSRFAWYAALWRPFLNYLDRQTGEAPKPGESANDALYHPPGTVVKIAYDPTQPERAILANISSESGVASGLYLSSLGCAVIGLLAIGLTVGGPGKDE